MKRGFAIARFAVGGMLGIGGLGLMGRATWPFHAGPFLVGVGGLVIGLFLALPTLTAVRRPR